MSEFSTPATEMEEEDNMTFSCSQDIKYKVDIIVIPKEDFHIFLYGSTVNTVVLIALISYLLLSSTLPKDAFKHLAMQHLLIGSLHVGLLTLYNLEFSNILFNYTLTTAYSGTDLYIVFTSTCISWIIFLRLFLFTDGEKLYNKKDITVSTTLFLTFIECYMAVMYLFDCDTYLRSILKLTCILLMMCVTFSVFFLILICMFTFNQLSRRKSLFALFHLLLIMISDVLLLIFNFDLNSNLNRLWDVLLYVRLILEIVWYFVYDRYLNNFVF